MNTVRQQQRTPLARTSITKAGQQMGCVRMDVCSAHWLKKPTRPGCLR